MKIIIVVITFLIPIEINAQSYYNNQSQSNLQPLKLKSSSGKNYVSLFNTGIEYGKLDILTEKYQYLHAFGIYFDFNIWKKILYINLDLGGFADRNFHSGLAYTALGLNYRFFGYGRHNFYFYSGFKGMAGAFYYGIAFVVSPKYVFSLSRLIGISGSIKYMERIDYKQRFLIYTAGVQFSFL